MTSSLDEVPYGTAAQELIAELQADIAAVLGDRLQLPAETAGDVAIEVAKRLGQRWGGLRIYFPRALVIEEQHWQIYQEFNGRNIVELARKHHLTEVWISRIVKRCRLVDMGRRQDDLFPGQEPDPSA